MTEINNINSLSTVRELANRKLQDQNKNETSSFGNVIKDYLKAVDKDSKIATEKVQNVLVNKEENIHEAMVTLEEASISLQMMLEVRNKLLESYQELKRMQV